MFIVQNIITSFAASSFQDVLGSIETIVNMVFSAIGGFCAFMGISYLASLKKQRNSAIFSFWLQLRVRIEELHLALHSDHSIINGLYSHETRIQWSNEGHMATDEIVTDFHGNVRETLQFIKSISDQIPANKSWLDAYSNFIKFLIDIIQYDIRNQADRFKFTGTETLADRDKYCEDICKTMDTLLTVIREEQEKIARKL